jgi:hypothetical protein
MLTADVAVLWHLHLKPCSHMHSSSSSSKSKDSQLLLSSVPCITEAATTASQLMLSTVQSQQLLHI